MRRWSLWGWLAGILAAGGVLDPPFWSGARAAALLVAAVLVLTATRELGRLAAGCLMGLRPAIVELGEAMPLARFRTGRLLWIIHRAPVFSATLWDPPPPATPVRGRRIVSLENVHRVGADRAFAVTVDQAADFAPLASYLCDAGCRLSVLPAPSEDPRLALCR